MGGANMSGSILLTFLQWATNSLLVITLPLTKFNLDASKTLTYSSFSMKKCSWSVLTWARDILMMITDIKIWPATMLLIFRTKKCHFRRQEWSLQPAHSPSLLSVTRTHALTYTHLSWWVPQRLSRPAHCMWRELSLEVTAVPWVTLSTTFTLIHLIKCVRARTCRQRLQIKIHMRLCWTLIAVISHWSQTHRKISADAQGGKWKVSTRTGCCFIIGYRMCWICFFLFCFLKHCKTE